MNYEKISSGKLMEILDKKEERQAAIELMMAPVQAVIDEVSDELHRRGDL